MEKKSKYIIGVMAGLTSATSYLLSLTMHDSVQDLSPHKAAMFMNLGCLFCIVVTVLFITLLVDTLTEEAAKVEDKQDPQTTDCKDLDFCPEESPTTCAFFGTYDCPQEEGRGDK
jgi:hypothetical protein